MRYYVDQNRAVKVRTGSRAEKMLIERGMTRVTMKEAEEHAKTSAFGEIVGAWIENIGTIPTLIVGGYF